MPHNPTGPSVRPTTDFKLIDLRAKTSRTISDRIVSRFAWTTERVLRLDRINDIFDACTSWNDPGLDPLAS